MPQAIKLIFLVIFNYFYKKLKLQGIGCSLHALQINLNLDKLPNLQGSTDKNHVLQSYGHMHIVLQ